MTEVYIDSASMYEIVSILRYERPEVSYPWAWCSAQEVTCSLINVPHLTLAPSPSVFGGTSGPYGQLMNEFPEFISHSKPKPKHENTAITSTKIWTDNNPYKVLAAYKEIKADRKNFPMWLEGAITHSWTEHSTRLGGLFNYEFLPQISQILNIDEKDLIDIWKLSCDQKILEEHAKHRFDGDDFKTMEDAYIISALIRGRYHDKVAELSEINILHHPIRMPMFNKPKDRSKSEFGLSNVENYLSSIIITGAYIEKTHTNRILCWAENVHKARIAAQKQLIDLRQKDSEDIALDLAVKYAKQLNIRVHPKWVEMIFEISAAMGVNFISSFIVNPFSSLVAGGISYPVSKKIDIGQKGANFFYGTEKRLRDLAVSIPGRIQSVWEK